MLADAEQHTRYAQHSFCYCQYTGARRCSCRAEYDFVHVNTVRLPQAVFMITGHRLPDLLVLETSPLGFHVMCSGRLTVYLNLR